RQAEGTAPLNPEQRRQIYHLHPVHLDGLWPDDRDLYRRRTPLSAQPQSLPRERYPTQLHHARPRNIRDGSTSGANHSCDCSRRQSTCLAAEGRHACTGGTPSTPPATASARDSSVASCPSLSARGIPHRRSMARRSINSPATRRIL